MNSFLQAAPQNVVSLTEPISFLEPLHQQTTDGFAVQSKRDRIAPKPQIKMNWQIQCQRDRSSSTL